MQKTSYHSLYESEPDNQSSTFNKSIAKFRSDCGPKPACIKISIRTMSNLAEIELLLQTGSFLIEDKMCKSVKFLGKYLFPSYDNRIKNLLIYTEYNHCLGVAGYAVSGV